MKKVLVLFAAVAMLAACSKESSPIENDPINEGITQGNEITLFASIPSMEDATKAIADGSFSWAEGDKIAIPVSGGYVDFTYNESKGAFTYTVTDEVFVDGKAYYPASSKPAGSYSTDFANAAAARSGFKMEADYTVGASSISFTHKSALIDLNFSNVPPFATSIRVKEGDVVVATVALSSPSSDVEVKVPVTPNGSKSYSFALMENSNVIKEVSKSSVSLTAGKYYSTPSITINHYVVFENSNNDTHKLGIQGRTLAEGWVENWGVKDLKTDGTVKYYILEDQYQSAEALRIVLRQNDANQSEAGIIVNDRNLTFDVSENSLKTAYRTYLRVNNTEYWGNGIGANIMDQYNEPKSYTAMTNAGTTNFWYYEWPASYYDWDLYIRMQNSSNTAWYLPASDSWWSIELNQDYIYQMNG